MPVSFQLMPATRRTPGVYTEFNTIISNRGLAPGATRVLFVGQTDSADGEAEDLDIYSNIASEAEAWTAFGRRSHLAKMIGAAFRANPGLNCDALAMADHGSATIWVYEYTFSGTATADGTVVISGTGGLTVSVTVSSGDGADDVATAVAAAIADADWPDLPYRVAVDGSTAEQVNFTAANGGTVANTLSIAVDTDGVAGISGSGSTTSGVNDPDLSAALDTVASEDYDFICVCLVDATNLGYLATHLVALINPLTSLGSIGVFAYPGNSLGAATTLAANFATNGMMTGAFYPASRNWEPVIAGCYVGVLSSQDDPALPYNTRVMTGLSNPDPANKLSTTEIETALLGGVSPIVVGAGNQPRIKRAISTYTQAPSGAADDALLDVTVMRSLFYVAFQIKNMLEVKYPQAKNIALRRSAIRADVLSVLFALEGLEIVADVAANQEGVLIEVNSGDATRCDLVVPAAVVRGLHVIAQRVDLRLPIAISA